MDRRSFFGFGAVLAASSAHPMPYRESTQPPAGPKLKHRLAASSMRKVLELEEFLKKRIVALMQAAHYHGDLNHEVESAEERLAKIPINLEAIRMTI
jgi:hypothetical protein